MLSFAKQSFPSSLRFINQSEGLKNYQKLFGSLSKEQSLSENIRKISETYPELHLWILSGLIFSNGEIGL